MSRRNPLKTDIPPLSPLPPPHRPLGPVWRWVVTLLLCAYVGLSLGHLALTPVATGGASYINAPDEAAHIEYARALAVGHRLPVREDPQYHTYEWHQPPAYYMVASAVYGLGPRAMRLLGVLLGAASLWLIYRAARILFPDDGMVAILALGFAALLPMRQAVFAAVGNDAPTELCFAWSFYLLVNCFRSGFTSRRAASLGLAVGVTILTKATGLLLLPVVLAALVLLRLEGEEPAAVLRGGATTFGVVALLVFPWLLRNFTLYHEFTPMKAFMQDFQGTMTAAKWLGYTGPLYNVWTGDAMQIIGMDRAGYLGLVANWTSGSFWAAYTSVRGAAIGKPEFLPAGFYWMEALIAAVALPGLVRLHLRRKTDTTAQQQHLIRLGFLLFGLVVLSFVGFVWVFFQTQGRYLYPAMAAIATLWAVGFRAATPGRYRDALAGLALGLQFVLALAFLLTAILPAYQ